MSQRKQSTSSKNVNPGTVQQCQENKQASKKTPIHEEPLTDGKQHLASNLSDFLSPTSNFHKSLFHLNGSFVSAGEEKKIKDLLKYAEVLHDILSWRDLSTFRANLYLFDDVTVLKAQIVIA